MFTLIDLYKNNKTKKIEKLDNSHIIEKHNFSYIFPIMLMKYGFFGSSSNYFNKKLYSFMAKRIYRKANKVFKSDMDCSQKISKFINSNNFSEEQINEIKNKEFTVANYPTLNHFFTREINMDLRNKITNKKKLGLYMPASSRCKFIKIDSNKQFNIKGKDIILKDIGFTNNDCSIIMINRLIPSDYHRYHAPASGKIIDIKEIVSDINISVNDYVIPEFNPYTLNSRKIVSILLVNNDILEICFIGATFVADIIINKKINDYVDAGTEIGYFKLGSCIITKLNNVKISRKIKYDTEYYVHVKDKFGLIIFNN